MYVTATTEQGTSLPSTRAIAETQHKQLGEDTKAMSAKVTACCRDQGVTASCVPRLCDLNKSPSMLGAVDVALSCRPEFGTVSRCLSDGRDHSRCCQRKGVNPQCLGLCNGSAKKMGLAAIMCLTIDMRAIYSCLREGYLTHPSPPRNVTVEMVEEGLSAVAQWLPPLENPDKVQSYSLFYGLDDGGNGRADMTEIKNVTSPILLEGLRPNQDYVLYLLAHSAEGTSLKSTILEFMTTGDQNPDGIVVDDSCPVGGPLRDPAGDLVFCSSKFPCPPLFSCNGLDGGESFCCPEIRTLTPDAATARKGHDIQACCKAEGVPAECLPFCFYNVTQAKLEETPRTCIRHIATWIKCGADERDHTPCCQVSLCSISMPPAIYHPQSR